ncbi:CRISPR-associated helicase Cas3' [Leptolyngbya sp. FACHB-321]|uniref:CRISPR-associated helicase Cas3' n=1 Tax=Leptolyngbya sp. FACHB-321 TaxID=2692807 RepID=UPI0016860AD8|nr:CRISPR-associated helicase Cas3' [Leptolyngbya sp. FACHB-321]MBD2037766.1 CRISPR-associated helicase Cas3' [Leptolyngbya sp. FACHB-321]
MSYIDLWAKTAQGTNFHPVICHLLDTAVVCRRLLQLLPAAAVARLQQGLGLDEASLSAWVPFLAGSHDTGKVSPPFQFQDSAVLEIAKQLAGGSLYDLWANPQKETLPKTAKPPGHGTITACTLPEYLQTWVDNEVADELAAIVGGHHGLIPIHDEIENITKGSQSRKYNLGNSAESPQWKQWRIEILDTLADYCGIKNTEPPQMPDAAAAVLLAGITTLADWLASNQDCFPAAGAKPDLTDYIDSLAVKVDATLKAAQWQEWQPHQKPLSFEELFKNEPRGLQEAIENLMPTLQGEPALLIVEAPTGEGKTEAALTVAHWHTSSGMPGTYIGMPTQATGNALYDRLKNYLNHWYPDQIINLQLAHSASALDENFSSTICRLENIHDKDHEPSGVAASEWFVHRKRALLAPWGVGTVDQALVGILRTKHQFLRLLGLAGKTVILDEVHAYDGYTSRLLDQLVHWCGILGSPVVVLSATLSSGQRQRLLTSYAEGLGLAKPELPVAEYPRLTVYAQGKATVDPSFTQEKLAKINRNKPVRIQWIEETQIDAYLGKGATAVIRSTVRRCQGTAEQYPQAEVFHSRFTQEHRQEKEANCLQHYGKPKSEDDAARLPSLLVATQVIEQSLDVDFDVLISDLCPIDLLIQRIGRLWRHGRKHRNAPERVIYLIRPKPGKSGLPNFGDDVESGMVKGRYQSRVYDRHALLRTWYLLRDRPVIMLPHDTDYLIQQAYELENPAPAKLTDAEQLDWDSSLAAYQNYQISLEKQAEQGLIPSLKHYCYAENLTNRSVKDDKEVEMVTRLINDSMTVILDTGDNKVIRDRAPVKDEIRQVLRQQVRLSSPGLIHALNKALGNLQIQVPKAWQEVTYLRELPLLNVPTQIGSYSITYSNRLGLVASRRSN